MLNGSIRNSPSFATEEETAKRYGINLEASPAFEKAKVDSAAFNSSIFSIEGPKRVAEPKEDVAREKVDELAPPNGMSSFTGQQLSQLNRDRKLRANEELLANQGEAPLAWLYRNDTLILNLVVSEVNTYKITNWDKFAFSEAIPRIRFSNENGKVYTEGYGWEAHSISSAPSERIPGALRLKHAVLARLYEGIIPEEELEALLYPIGAGYYQLKAIYLATGETILEAVYSDGTER